MRRYIKWSFLICLLILCVIIPFGTGPSAAKNRYVVQAQISLYKSGQQHNWTYLQPEKISSILNYLRTTEPRGRVYCAQSDANSHHYRITLYYSDGSENTYYLQDYRFFCKNTDLWQRVSDVHAHLLYPLLQLLPTDA